MQQGISSISALSLNTATPNFANSPTHSASSIAHQGQQEFDSSDFPALGSAAARSSALGSIGQHPLPQDVGGGLSYANHLGSMQQQQNPTQQQTAASVLHGGGGQSLSADDFPALSGPAANGLPPPSNNMAAQRPFAAAGNGQLGSLDSATQAAQAALAHRQGLLNNLGATATTPLRQPSGPSTPGSNMSAEEQKRNYALKLNQQAFAQQQQQVPFPTQQAQQQQPAIGSGFMNGLPNGLPQPQQQTNGRMRSPQRASTSSNSSTSATPNLVNGHHAASQPLPPHLQLPSHNSPAPPSTQLPQTPAQQILYSPADRFGLLGLLQLIKMGDSDATMLSLGSDLSKLGLDLGRRDNLYSTLVTPWASSTDASQASVEPEFSLPFCYNVVPPAASSKIGQFSDETLFYIFYTQPRDFLQEAAAAELYRHNWRYHKELRLWLTKEAGTEATQKTSTYERGSYVFFDPTSWEKIKKDFVLLYEQLENRPQQPSLAAQQALTNAIDGGSQQTSHQQQQQ